MHRRALKIFMKGLTRARIAERKLNIKHRRSSSTKTIVSNAARLFTSLYQFGYCNDMARSLTSKNIAHKTASEYSPWP